MFERKLQPAGFDAQEWEWSVKFPTVSGAGGSQVARPLRVLQAAQNKASHSIEFEFKTCALFRSEINIFLWVSAAAKATMYVNDRPGGRFVCPASGGQTARLLRITKDVTEWAEENQTSRLRLFISYDAGSGRTTFPFDGDWPAAESKLVPRRWNLYFLQSTLFFFLIWVAILSTAVLILAPIQILGGSFRFYAVLTTILVWLVGLLGLSDLAKIPVQSKIRQLWDKTRSRPAPARPTQAGAWNRFKGWVADVPLARRRRAFALAMLLPPTVLAALFAGRIIYGMAVHHYYTSLINRAIEGSNQDEFIRRAFVLVPWRKEAQILLERRAWSLRNPAEKNSNFKRYIRDFVSHDDVRRAVNAAKSASGLPFYLTPENQVAFSDPVLWYASLIPEGEQPGETKARQDAFNYLSPVSGETNPEAVIHRTVLRMELVQANRKEIDEAAGELCDLLLSYYNHKNVASSFAYQVGCDTLASYYIQSCNAGEAAKWFQEVVEARRRQRTLTSELIWHRPPEKLILYYMFGTSGGSDVPLLGTQEAIDRAQRLRDFCPDFKNGFERRFLGPYEEYKKPEAWRINTALDDKVISYVSGTLLNKGWRY